MPSVNPPDFRPDPASGRVFVARRIVRSTDVTPSGRLRLDALARYLQNVAEDDAAAAGQLTSVVWLVRRCAITVRAFPAMGDRLTLRTFCSGTGPRWAERTTTLTGESGDLLQAVAIWAAVSRTDGRPVAPGEAFAKVYGEAAQGRTVSARLTHPRPDGCGAGRRWPLRAADFDTAGHVNNSVHWAAVEDVLAAAGWPPARAEIEYHRAILPGWAPRLVTAGDGQQLVMWLLADDGKVLASAVVFR
jgi:acyl-ACP thioesterase